MSKEVINLQKLYEQMIGKEKTNLQLTSEIIVPKIGKTYLPPMSLNLENTIQPKRKPKKYQVYDTVLPIIIPLNFSWNNLDDIKLRNEILNPKIKIEKEIILPASNQFSCGSCWAWSTVTAMSDRIAISTGKNPQLGPSYIMSCGLSKYCNPKLTGCNGGYLDLALEDMAIQAGTVTDSCWGYDWCDNDCITGLNNQEQNNNMLPVFDNCSGLIIKDPNDKTDCIKNKETCISNLETPFKGLYKVVPGTVDYFSSFDEIRESVFLNGPVPCGFRVFNDFMSGTSTPLADGWAKTNGIYVHLDRTINKVDPFPYKYGTEEVQSIVAGGHAAVIVGWGMEEVDNFLVNSYPNLKKIKLPYWIARNSWSEEWNNGFNNRNEKGFFRIAMSDSFRGINTNVYFDALKMWNGSDWVAPKFGGPLNFEIETELSYPEFKIFKTAITLQKKILYLLIIVIIILVIIQIIIWVANRK